MNDWLARAKSDRSNMELIGREHRSEAGQWWAAAPCSAPTWALRVRCHCHPMQVAENSGCSETGEVFIPSVAFARYQSPFACKPHKIC